MESIHAQPTFRDRMRTAPVPEWIVKMQEHYRQTGTYRAEDLRRLLGDQRRGVSSDPNSTLATSLASN
jgi:hypothetical protein